MKEQSKSNKISITTTTDIAQKDSIYYFVLPRISPNIRSFTCDDFLQNLDNSLVKIKSYE